MSMNIIIDIESTRIDSCCTCAREAAAERVRVKVAVLRVPRCTARGGGGAPPILIAA